MPSVRVSRSPSTRSSETGPKAYREAVELLQQASRLLDELPETRQTLTEALSVRMALGPALMANQGAGAVEVEASYLGARQLCERLEDNSRLFPVLWGLGYVNHSRGEYARARELAAQVLSLAHIAEDPAFLLEANHAMWSTAVAMGRPAQATDYLQQGLALSDLGQRRSWWLYGAHDPGVCCRHMLAIAFWLRGYPEQALKWAREAVRRRSSWRLLSDFLPIPRAVRVEPGLRLVIRPGGPHDHTVPGGLTSLALRP